MIGYTDKSFTSKNGDSINFCPKTETYTLFNDKICYFVDLEFDSITVIQSITNHNVFNFVQPLLNTTETKLPLLIENPKYSLLSYTLDSDSNTVFFTFKESTNTIFIVIYKYNKIGVKPKFKSGLGTTMCQSCNKLHQTTCVSEFVEMYTCTESNLKFIRNRQPIQSKQKYFCEQCGELHYKSKPVTDWIEL